MRRFKVGRALRGVFSASLFFRTNEFLHLVVIADEKEHKFGRGRYENESEAVVQSNAAFKDGFCEPTNADAGVKVRFAP